MILEGMVTTRNQDGTLNIAPMGPRVDRQITRLTLRPFQTARTFQNLLRHPEGVFHVVDDVELLAHCAVGGPLTPPATQPALCVDGEVLQAACRWFEFRVVSRDIQAERATLDCEVVEQGRLRDFFGFNRAKHAVIEASILATRVHLIEPDVIRAQLQQYATIVEKTAGDQEQRAFAFLTEWIHNKLASTLPLP